MGEKEKGKRKERQIRKKEYIKIERERVKKG